MNESEFNQKTYYNKISNEYQKHYGDKYALKYRFDLYHKAFKNINLKDLNVLDAMCGGGQSSLFFDKFNCKIVGVDISEEQCLFFKEKLPKHNVICSSILDFKTDKKFDLIITDSLHHLHPNVDEVLNLFDKLLNPSGYIIVWEPNRDSLFDLIRRLIYKIDSKYFLENEESISVSNLSSSLKDYKLISLIYGGNFGYLLLNLSMALRLPNSYKKYIYKTIMIVERMVSFFQFKINSLWLLAIYKKKS